MVRYFSLIILGIAFLGVVLSSTSGAFYNDSGLSNTNVFAAASTFPTATPSATVSPTPPIAHTLVMNEVLPISSCVASGTTGQFVELWNGSGATVDLKDFKLSDGTNTIAISNSQTDLANGAFAILVKSNGVVNGCLGGNVNDAITVNLGGTVDLNTGVLRLIAPDGITVIDRVEFGSNNGGVLQTIPDQSIERNLLGLDSALGDTFAVSDFGKQCPVTPGTWLTPTGNCTVVINELMWMGSIASTADEWIELRNTTSNPINIAGWVIKNAATSNGDLTIATGTIPANGFFLISNFAASNASSHLNVVPDLVTTSVSLDNTAARYVLLNSTGKTVDVVDDGVGAPLAGDDGTVKKSMERNSTAGNGALGANWHTATTSVNWDAGATELGTPKAVND